jgi:citrate synthase
MTQPSGATAAPPPPPTDDRPYSPGLEGVIAGETALSKVDGANGRLMYRGYRIGDLVEHGTCPAVANLLTGDWCPGTASRPPRPDAVMTTLRALPRTAKPMDALGGPPSRPGGAPSSSPGHRPPSRPGL